MVPEGGRGGGMGMSKREGSDGESRGAVWDGVRWRMGWGIIREKRKKRRKGTNEERTFTNNVDLPISLDFLASGHRMVLGDPQLPEASIPPSGGC